jgi:hypothetical protein
MRPISITAAVLVISSLASTARAGEPIGMFAGGDLSKMSREDCQAKALDALREHKFPHAEITPDGFVLGRNAKATVMVFAFPYRDGVVALVAAVSKEKEEAERLRNEIRESVLDPSHEADTDSIRQVTHSEMKNSLGVRWSIAKHGFLPTVRFFDAAATIVMEKHNLRTSTASKMMVFGGNDSTGVMAVLVPGANEVSVQLLVIGVSADEKEADRLQKMVSAELIKVLFE